MQVVIAQHLMVGLTTAAPSQIRLAGTLQTSNDAMSLGDLRSCLIR